ncbi:5-methyltetrahydrofolate--homocysteine methyltransferase [Clostridium sp. AWRP]|uniref:5-methyltetrahydrofolate--homocysteine methyltransferase n=1 Tax=Clostridium sp. AWRP TaxID=2212991 RepID=UPI000FD9E135|nr:5-methyltetrahydrofolate--homocysteine methyltransferase [Clostridium sp. AWRP]AZV55844.1 5-methyltetrahydrofolate--homocysteine methyltransferase [Clostridium sp. AWRP]
MDVILDFDFKLNKDQVMQTLKSYGSIIKNEEMEGLYEKLLPILYENIEPTGIFEIEKKEDNFNFEAVKNYEYIVYCIITMGDNCTSKVNEFFSYGNMKEGMMLDAMASSYLFELSSQLFSHIYTKVKELHLGLSCRISPGDGEIPLKCQKYILDKLDAENFLNLTVNEDYMLSSMRSMAYIYGADKNIKLSKKDHDCSRCPNRNLCNMRKS